MNDKPGGPAASSCCQMAGSVGLERKDLLNRGWTSAVLWKFPNGLTVLGFAIFWWWPLAAGALWSAGFLWTGAACTVNSLICKRVHCFFTGPLYLVLGLLSLGKILGLTQLNWAYIWLAYVVVWTAARIPEWLGEIYFEKASP